jgi:hypothetical protein
MIVEILQDPVYFSGGYTGGADEDDFHTLKRRRADVDHEEKSEQRQARTAKKEVRNAPNPSLINGVAVKRSSGAKAKVVAFWVFVFTFSVVGFMIDQSKFWKISLLLFARWWFRPDPPPAPAPSPQVERGVC